MGRLAPWLPLLPGLLWLLLLFLLPLLGLLVCSLSVPMDRFSLALRFDWHWANYAEALHRHGALLLRSLGMAGLATLLAALIGYPLAWVIAFRGGRWRGLLLGLVVVPFFTSTLVRAIAWTTLLADEGPLLALLRRLELVQPLQLLGLLSQGRLLNTGAAVVGGLTYNALPLMVLPIVVGLERLDPLLLEAADDLHADPSQRFRRVVWPLSLPGLAAGCLLSLIPALGDVVSPRLLGGPNDRMVGNAIESLLLVQQQLPLGAALAWLLMGLVLVPLLLLLLRRERRQLLLR
ncbi:MAG: ABC transporter permease [Synechococcaceae cyanobacterium]|nr:ABC transporter permease [Synechococcaceae cyanobacterium]